MDVVSHALWGYAATRWLGPRAARWGAVAGAAPDLLYSGAALVERVAEQGLGGLRNFPGSGDNSIWRRDGPPMPEELVAIYNNYYVYTHSLVILAGIALLYYLLRRCVPWLLLPCALHILMDIPSHERYLTPFLFPLSRFTVMGVSWARPPMLVLNFGGLALVYIWIYLRYWRKRGNKHVEGLV